MLSYERRRIDLSQSCPFAHPIFSISYNTLMQCINEIKEINISMESNNFRHTEDTKLESLIRIIFEVIEENNSFVLGVKDTVNDVYGSFIPNMNINDRIENLEKLLKNYKEFIKTKIVDSFSSLIVKSLMKEYDLLDENNVEITIRVGITSGKQKNIIFTPTLKMAKSSIIDRFESYPTKLLNIKYLVLLSALLIKPENTSLCKILKIQ